MSASTKQTMSGSSRARAVGSVFVVGFGSVVLVVWAMAVLRPLAVRPPVKTSHVSRLPIHPLAVPDCTPATALSGPSLTISTPKSDLLSFSSTCLLESPGADFQISYTNNTIPSAGGPAAPQNISIYASAQDAYVVEGNNITVDADTRAKALFLGQPAAEAGQTVAYKVSGLPAGTYYFQDDFHPMSMHGTLLVQ